MEIVQIMCIALQDCAHCLPFMPANGCKDLCTCNTSGLYTNRVNLCAKDGVSVSTMPLSQRVYCDSRFELQGCLSLQQASWQYRSGVSKVRQGGSILQSLLFITFKMGLKGKSSQDDSCLCTYVKHTFCAAQVLPSQPSRRRSGATAPSCRTISASR